MSEHKAARPLTAEETLESLRTWALDMQDQALKSAEDPASDALMSHFNFGHAAAYKALVLAISRSQSTGFTSAEARVKELEAQLQTTRDLLTRQAEIGEKQDAALTLQQQRIAELEGLLRGRGTGGRVQ